MITTQTKAMSMKEKPFYKAEELAEMLEVNIMTIYRYIKGGRLKAYKIGREFRIEKSEFQSFLKKVRTK
jgi:putative molybdopterin biosynthesis protein